MPYILKLDDSTPKLRHTKQFCISPLKSYGQIELDSVVNRLRSDEINSLLEFVKNADDRLCNMVSQYDETALSVALYRKSFVLCKALIEKGCDVNKEAKFPPFYIKLSPLSYAVTQGNIDMVKMFIHHGCEPTTSNDQGKNAVHFAICGGHIDILQLFLTHGCDPNVRIPERQNFTLLHEATYRGNIDAVKVLLEAKADPNLYEFNERTIPAFQTHDVPIHKLLLQYGSDINWRSRLGETILHSAVILGKLELVEVLLENGAVMDYCQTLITYSRDNISCNIQKKDLFQLAIREKNYDICSMLLKHGFQLDIFNLENQITLSNIVFSWQIELLDLLIQDHQIGKNYIKLHNSVSIYFKFKLIESYKLQPLEDICRSVLRKSLKSSCPKNSIYYKLNSLKCVPHKLSNFIIYRDTI